MISKDSHYCFFPIALYKPFVYKEILNKPFIQDAVPCMSRIIEMKYFGETPFCMNSQWLSSRIYSLSNKGSIIKDMRKSTPFKKVFKTLCGHIFVKYWFSKEIGNREINKNMLWLSLLKFNFRKQKQLRNY